MSRHWRMWWYPERGSRRRRLERLEALALGGFEEPQMTDLASGRLELTWPEGENVIEGYGMSFARATQPMCRAVEALVGRRVIARLQARVSAGG